MTVGLRGLLLGQLKSLPLRSGVQGTWKVPPLCPHLGPQTHLGSENLDFGFLRSQACCLKQRLDTFGSPLWPEVASCPSLLSGHGSQVTSAAAPWLCGLGRTPLTLTTAQPPEGPRFLGGTCLKPAPSSQCQISVADLGALVAPRNQCPLSLCLNDVW